MLRDERSKAKGTRCGKCGARVEYGRMRTDLLYVKAKPNGVWRTERVWVCPKCNEIIRAKENKRGNGNQAKQGGKAQA
jgi:hypothetical protein